MAAFHSQAAVNNAYYDNIFSSNSLRDHHNPTLPMIIDQNAAIFGHVHAGYVLMYSQYWAPLYYHQYHQPQPCGDDDSWVLNAQEEEEEHDARRHQFMPCDESLILNAQVEEEEEEEEEEEIELSEEELREWNLLDRELVFYDASDDDDGLSKETITKHLRIRDCHDHHHHHHHHDVDSDDQICVVCQDCLLDEDEKIATLDCGHDFHAGCIESWLMLKNSCPLCKKTGIRF